MALAAVAAIALFTAAGISVFRKSGTAVTETKNRNAGKTAAAEPVSVSQPGPGWWESRRLIYFNIPARILYYLPEADRPAAKKMARTIWKEFDRIGRIFNPSDPDSELSRLNAADKTKAVPVSEDLYTVLKISGRLWHESRGAFDPTIAPLKKLWRQAVKTQKIPSNRQIQRVLRRTGFDKVRLLDSPRSVICDAQSMVFDFGGIAKGFAVDQTSSLLRSAGISDGLVQLGGEVSAFGSNLENRPWRIGIQHPEDMDKAWGIIENRHNIMASTSGNYRQPMMIQGHAFYHIISPKTGRPVSEKILGVTTAVFETNASSSAMLDGAATAITVLGRDQGLELAKRLNIAALILSMGTNKEIRQHLTPDFSDRMDVSMTAARLAPAAPNP